jgi:uncharacterized membrane protein
VSTKTVDERGAHVAGSPREPRWPATLAAAVALALYLTLPDRLTIGPTWLIPAAEGALLFPLTISRPYRSHDESAGRVISLGLVAVINAANVVSLGLLVHSLVAGVKAEGEHLIVSAIQIWLTNVLVFALWYWELDRGGPGRRAHPHHREPDFLFPQMTTPHAAPRGWRPAFVDYLYVAFTNATAFSPTDTMPLTPTAKMLMLVESLASFVTVAVVAARAVNILV